MRGKVKEGFGRIVEKGITPAYAGKSMEGVKMSGILEDHPRLCGEKVQQHKAAVRIQGSPPPMRGKGTVPALGEQHTGITPAYAGKSASLTPPLVFHIGSPPPMRGKVASAVIACMCVGITPAYAGKSREYLQNIKETQDHPRLCGEKIFSCREIVADKGSPPPMRGKVNTPVGG